MRFRHLYFRKMLCLPQIVVRFYTAIFRIIFVVRLSINFLLPTIFNHTIYFNEICVDYFRSVLKHISKDTDWSLYVLYVRRNDMLKAEIIYYMVI